MIASKVEKPWWVAVSLWGMPTRGAMWLWFWCAIAAGLATVGWALVSGSVGFYGGALMFFAAIPYWMTIRWMDAHRAW